MQLASLINNAAKMNAIILSQDQIEKIELYLNMLIKWNNVFNLTAVTDPYEIVHIHLIDSLLINPYLKGSNCLDVGSGGGLPGIILAIVDESKNWVLLDKNSKKTRFLTQVKSELSLSNVDIALARAQDFVSEKCFDTILARALGTIKFFVEITQHLICPDGIFLAMKGLYPKEELLGLPEAFKVREIIPLEMKGRNLQRHVVCLEHVIGGSSG